jgi:hypothetical protein
MKHSSTGVVSRAQSCRVLADTTRETRKSIAVRYKASNGVKSHSSMSIVLSGSDKVMASTSGCG